MQQIASNINKSQRSWFSLHPHIRLISPTTFAGDQLQDKSLQWLYPADPSSNYNIARKAYRDGTAAWFTQSTTFHEWEAPGSLLWIHGKRMVFPTSCLRNS